MRKLTLIYLLKRMVVLLTVLAGCMSAPEVLAQPCPQGAIGNPPALPGAPCKKWTFDFDSNNPNKYLSRFPNNCDNSYTDESGNKILTCYWSNPYAACKAFITSENSLWTYVKAVKSSGDPLIYRCHYKIPNSRTIFDDHVVRFEQVRFFPYQPHCNTEVNGPYRDCPDAFTLCGTNYNEAQRGFEFTRAQKNLMKSLNKARNFNKKRDKGELVSDLAGYRYPKSALPMNQTCIKEAPDDPSMCIEPATPLNENPQQSGAKDYHNVHHVIPKKDRQGCPCGKNSMKNAVIISRQLNAFFLNFKRPTNEIVAVNMAGNNPYPCSSQVAPPSSKPSINMTVKKPKKLSKRSR